jgi:peptidoglycan L-alanyl-D-glutamate endopeptidase CwlK
VKYSLSRRSLGRLEDVHPDMVLVVKRAIEISEQDFMVLEGVRTPERQRELYAQGRTAPGQIVTWTLKSNHFVQDDGYGHAVDLVPFPVDWADSKKFDAIAEAMFAASEELRVPIRWGRDWNQNGKPGEKGESDSPHFELVP